MSTDKTHPPNPTTPEQNPFAEFLDDYFAESDAHMTNARRHLLTLETYIDNQVEPSIIEELLRSFHTIKGLSGMVGVKEAETLAHEIESYLRTLRSETATLTSQGMDALMAGVQMLQQAIAARKEQTPPPHINPTVAQLQALLPPPDPDNHQLAGADFSAPPSPRETGSAYAGEQGSKEEGEEGEEAEPIILNHAETEKLHLAQTSGHSLWHFQFTPQPTLADRNINVNTIRDRLTAIGQIIHASPRMLKGGQIVFDFILSHPPTNPELDPTTPDALAAYGLTYTSWLAPGDQRTVTPSPSLPVQESPSLPIPPSPSLPVQESPSLPVQESPSLPVQESPPLPVPPSPLLPISVMPANVVRVDLTRLDELMQTLGELVISRARLEDRLKQLLLSHLAHNAHAHLRPLLETNQQMERQLRDLRAQMLRVRLVPISDIFTRMQFMVRDLARTSGKQVKVEISGEDTEIDKFVVERLMDPLLHLVRNAISHGLESPAEREAMGKPKAGRVMLRAATVGEMAVVDIEDDGRGIDSARIIAKGRQMGILDPQTPYLDSQTPPLTNTLLLDILCTSGFSTRSEADLTSGRGVGLAVVHRSVQELGGSLSLDTQVGVKTRFRLQLPLTLAIADALLASAGGQTFAIPLSAVQEIIEVKPEAITAISNFSGRRNRTQTEDSASIIYHRGAVLPLLRLTRFFNLSQQKGRTEYALIVGFGNESDRLGVVVDRVLGQREIVVRPLTDQLVNVPGISGATDLGDGQVVLILDAIDLIRNN